MDVAQLLVNGQEVIHIDLRALLDTAMGWKCIVIGRLFLVTWQLHSGEVLLQYKVHNGCGPACGIYTVRKFCSPWWSVCTAWCCNGIKMHCDRSFRFIKFFLIRRNRCGPARSARSGCWMMLQWDENALWLVSYLQSRDNIIREMWPRSRCIVKLYI